MRYTAFVFLLFAAFSLAAQQPTQNRRHYRPSRDFLANADENCFEAARREADRAFAQRCWDDASLLYRAAKNCADADQKRRQEMSDRLEACREAAELELINRERQAIAANRADDSHELLRIADRSLAFRMADFANTYIAPPDEQNPDCQQAIFDTWYASPGALGGEYDDTIQAPFCYQLGENLGSNVIVRLTGKGEHKRIYAFSVNQHLLYSWDAQTLEALTPAPVDATVTGFDVSPDGNTFLFYSDKLLIFWRKGRELYRLNIQRMHDYCFDVHSDEFFLLDTIERKIEALSLREVYVSNNYNKMQKQRKIEELRLPPTFRPWMTGVGPELLDFAVWRGDTWLGYRDSVLYLRKPQAGQSWQIVKTFPVGRPNDNSTSFNNLLRLMPEKGRAFYYTESSSIMVTLPLADSIQSTQTRFSGYPLALPSEDGHVASLVSESYLQAGTVRIFNETGGLEYVGAIQELEYYGLLAGSMDTEGEWLVLPSNAGTLNCWRLGESKQNIFYNFRTTQQAVGDISPDGRYYISMMPGSLNVCDCVRPGETVGSPFPLIEENTNGFLENKISNHWVATPWQADSLLVWNWETEQRWFFPVLSSSGRVVVFSNDERYIATEYSQGQIRVYDLRSGAVAATRTYSGQMLEMAFVPDTYELVVLQTNTSAYDYSQKKVLRIVHPFRNDYKPRTVRLHEYDINLMAVSGQGEFLALSNGTDVRIFALDNLTDEMAQILPAGEGLAQGTTAQVMAIQFTPDGQSLVVAYSDQNVVFWNIETRQVNFNLRLPSEAAYMAFTKIRIIPEGNLLCLLAPGDGLLVRTLDMDIIRGSVQPPNYHLISFNANQINKYNLDQALNYPGNFERLAGSGDIPLIKSFLNYYYEQAVVSNNIDRVNEYCDRAFVLYSQLDTATQRESRQSLVNMYESCIWKWLIRDRPDKAEQVLQYLNKQFKRPAGNTPLEAHIALVKGRDEDLRRAARLYIDWITTKSDASNETYFDPSLNTIFDNFAQLAEFELIGEKQINFLCGMFGEWSNFILCSKRPAVSADAVPLDTEMKLRWDIYKKTYHANQSGRFSERITFLDQARAYALQLSRLKPAAGRTQLEKITNQMGLVYQNWAVFEQGNDLALEISRKGIDLLEKLGPSHQEEQVRLENLAYLYLQLGSDQYNRDQFAEAMEAGKAGYNVSELLWNMAKDTSELRRMADQVVGPLYTLLGNISLMTGDLATARTAYDEANSLLSQGLNSYFVAHVDLMEGKEIDALLNYGGIFSTAQLGSAIFDLERLADRMPAQKDSILAFIPRLRTAWLANHLRSSTYEVDYRVASLQTYRAALLKNYSKALEWNDKAMKAVEQLISNKNTEELWESLYSDVRLNQSYYLILNAVGDTALLTYALEMSLKWEEEALKQGDGSFIYHDEYLRTNIGHGYLLRNRPGDREKAIQSYRDFLSADGSGTGVYWDILQKDFRDLIRAGFRITNLRSLIDEIKPPGVTISAEEWKELEVRSEK